MLKVDKEGQLFYGVSAKRYALLTRANGKIRIYEKDDEKGYKLHRLGYLSNPFGTVEDWHKQFWEDGLKLHYGNISAQDIIDKYSKCYAVSQLSVSTMHILKQFATLNNGKPFSQQVKPFNFFLIGFGTDRELKPMASYTKQSQEIVHKPFIDYKTGQTLSGIEYWQPLSGVFFDFFDHPESKLEGAVGVLRRPN